ncbi:MAG TPA: DUF1993 domain-containing protein [Xanthobacteraceae bacterium]
MSDPVQAKSTHANVIHAIAMGTFTPMLRVLANLFDKATEHARVAQRDPDALADARLAPDMFPLVRQVQIGCDHAKTCAALLAGQTAPRFEDTEKTLAELKERIARTTAYLDAFSASAFEGAAEREIRHALLNGLSLEMTGLQYLRDWALPHFYFHVVTAYDILRHNGVDIGKRDYLSYVGYAIRQAA